MEIKTITLPEAAKLLGYKSIWRLSNKCSKGLIPGAFKIGKSWMVYLPPLLEYIENEYKLRREAAQVALGGKQWQSLKRKADVICIQNLRSVESELMKARKQIREQTRKSMKKNVEKI